jgi:serine/threonine protein kinase
MARQQHSAARDKLPTVVHGTGEETAAGPQSDTVTKADFIPAKLQHYKVLHKLGQGGMGWVMLAEDTQLGRRVALKVMRSQHAAEEESRERFLREARAAAQLKHDHIITIYQVGEDQGVPFLAMELLEGGTLQQRLEYPKPLSLGAAVRIAREIAVGLNAAHQRGVVHRDIKPANIWLESPKGRVKILDFGLARQSDSKAGLTQAGEIVGTPHYMAPEQARAKPVDARCDLFSLGCILYRMTTGRLPFAGDTLLATLTAIAVDMPTPVRELNPQAPQALADLIWRLLAKDPNQRPATAKEVIDELAAIERDLSGGSKSGFSIEVPPMIQLKTDAPIVVPSAKKASLSGRLRPASRNQSLLPWILAGGLLALALLGLLWLITWAMNLSTQPSRGTARGSQRPPTDFRRVVPLDAPSAITSRKTAEWVFAKGGPTASVQVVVTGQPAVAISAADLLPSEPFALVGVRLAGSTIVNDRDLARLAGMKSLSLIDLSGTTISDAGIKQLTDISALTSINLEGTNVTDDGVSHLVRTCPNLNRLLLGKSKCTPAVVEAISHLKQMRDLSLAGVPVVDEHLATISRLVNLQILNLAQTKVTDAGVAHLARLSQLQNLRLDGTQISDVGLGALAMAHSQLFTLSLNRMPNITGAGLAQLAHLSRLEWLEIRGSSRISDDGLDRLTAISSLMHLEVDKGQFSAAAIDKLRTALPGCELLQREADSLS